MVLAQAQAGRSLVVLHLMATRPVPRQLIPAFNLCADCKQVSCNTAGREEGFLLGK